MRSILRGGFALALAFLAVSATFAAAASADETIHVVERATTDAVTNGSQKDVEGNVLTFHNQVYDASNKTRVGRDEGYCIRTIVGKSWLCTWTTYLEAGSITVEGPFSDTGNTVLAITGGTGAYATAGGTMNLKYRNKKGTAFDFIFHLG
jgi:allene oxide cyclase